MSTNDLETVFVDGFWKNQLEGKYSTKADAQAVGRGIAKYLRVEHIIKNKDGTIAERNSYGHDPSNVPG